MPRRPSRAWRRKRRTLRPGLALSALLHALLVAAILLSLHKAPPETIVPPSSFAVIFEHGGGPEAKAPRTTPSPMPLPPEAPSRPAPAAPRPAPPTPLPQREASAEHAPAPHRATPPAAPPHPAAPPLPSLAREIPNRLPELLGEGASLHATLAPPRAAPRAPPRERASRPPARAPSRYTVMNGMSFSGAREPPSSGRRLNLALNRSPLDAAISNQFAIEGEIGPDWRAELTAWVNARKYYPRTAIEMGQQGAVEIRFVVDRSGRVLAVSLLQSSGSPFLDQAWLSLFRGAELPPFPPGTHARELTIRATMHYILID